MKKLLFIILCSILIVVAICFLIFNSENYKHKLTIKYRDENLTKLNQIPRLYIYEGVYSFESHKTSNKTSLDKFGEPVTTSSTEYVGTGEVSFKSDKIVILLNNEREEIILAEPYISQISEKDISYCFPIVQWKSYKDNTCFFSFDSIENKGSRIKFKSPNSFLPPTLDLSINSFMQEGKEKSNATINIMAINAYKFVEDTINRLNIKGLRPFKDPLLEEIDWYPLPFNLDGFKILPNRFSYISMNTLKYRYDPFYTYPSYTNTKYADEEYDFNVAFDRVKRSYFKNPFILNHKWK